jgi:hypothetical protein
LEVLILLELLGGFALLKDMVYIGKMFTSYSDAKRYEGKEAWRMPFHGFLMAGFREEAAVFCYSWMVKREVYLD